MDKNKDNANNLSVAFKRAIISGFDYMILLFSYAVGINFIRPAGGSFYTLEKGQLAGCLIALFIIQFALFRSLDLYRSLWVFSAPDEFIRCVWASGGTILIWIGVSFASNKLFQLNISISIQSSIIAFLCMLFGFTLMRYLYRLLRRIYHGNILNRNVKKRVLVVGEGVTGRFFVDSLKTDYNNLGVPIGFVDDDLAKRKDKHNGIRVIGTTEDIPKIVKIKSIDTIVVCMPNTDGEKRSKIIDKCVSTECDVKICSAIETLYDGKSASRMRPVEISDLLSRPEIRLDRAVCNYLNKSTVLITGGGGSIGSEIANQVAKYEPATIVIFDIYENCAFELQNELKRQYGDEIEIAVRIGSVRDIARLREIFTEFCPDVVFHAAAHKHVPLMEDSPCETVKNNVFGTYNTAFVANEFGVKKFVLLSTDKAVNPTNVMGTTKRVAELIIQYMNYMSKNTCYTAVRFGNVLGSHGSVIPIFEKQIKNGGPVCVTHPKIERYFMTIPEAAQLVCQAGGLSNGGEIFVLDMGEPVKIIELAKNLIHLSGFTEEEIEIKFTGLRPGEKLYEELALESELENRKKTANNKIYVTFPPQFNNEEFLNKLNSLKDVDNSNVRKKLKEIVTNYSPTNI